MKETLPPASDGPCSCSAVLFPWKITSSGAACATRQVLALFSSVACTILKPLDTLQFGFINFKTFQLYFNASTNAQPHISVISFYFFREHLVIQCRPKKEKDLEGKMQKQWEERIVRLMVVFC